MQESTYFSGFEFARNVSFSGGLLQHHPKEGLFECGHTPRVFVMFKGDKYGKPCISYWIWMDINCRISYVALGRLVDFPRTSCLPRRVRSIKPRAMVVPYQGLLYFCGLNQSFYMCLEETVIRLDLPIVIYSLRGFFWVGFTNAFLLFFFLLVLFVVKVASQQIRPNKCLEFTRKNHWQKNTVPVLGSRTWISKRWLQEWSPVFFFP